MRPDRTAVRSLLDAKERWADTRERRVRIAWVRRVAVLERQWAAMRGTYPEWAL